MQVNRRDFFRTLFGATVVALVPEPVMRAIEEVTPPPVEHIGTEPILHPFPDKCLFIYDGNDHLLGYSYDFNLIFSREFVKLGHPWNDPEYFPGRSEWNVEVPKINGTGEMEYMVFTDALSRGGS